MKLDMVSEPGSRVRVLAFAIYTKIVVAPSESTYMPLELYL
jgi:hypothetical protein